jgi:hypothetical protein
MKLNVSPFRTLAASWSRVSDGRLVESGVGIGHVKVAGNGMHREDKVHGANPGEIEADRQRGCVDGDHIVVRHRVSDNVGPRRIRRVDDSRFPH